jgi:hypothetical protein
LEAEGVGNGISGFYFFVGLVFESKIDHIVVIDHREGLLSFDVGFRQFLLIHDIVNLRRISYFDLKPQSVKFFSFLVPTEEQCVPIINVQKLK